MYRVYISHPRPGDVYILHTYCILYCIVYILHVYSLYISHACGARQSEVLFYIYRIHIAYTHCHMMHTCGARQPSYIYTAHTSLIYCLYVLPCQAYLGREPVLSSDELSVAIALIQTVQQLRACPPPYVSIRQH